MPRGGKPGQPKTGGRRKGTPNKINAKHREAIIKQGITPLQYMIDVLNDPKSPIEDRKWAAQQAAPYMHSRPATTVHSTVGIYDLSKLTENELRELATALERASAIIGRHEGTISEV